MSDDDKMTQEDYEFYSHRQLVETVMANAVALERLRDQLDRANASKLRIQRDSDRESKCERDESEYQCDACARCYQRVSEQLDRENECWMCKASLELPGTPESRVLRCIDCPEPESLDDVDHTPEPAEPSEMWRDVSGAQGRAIERMRAELDRAAKRNAELELMDGQLRSRVVVAELALGRVTKPAEPRPMSEAPPLPRVWVGADGPRMHAGLVEWMGWGCGWVRTSGGSPIKCGTIFVPAGQRTPDGEPLRVTPCSKVDWLPSTTAAGGSEGGMVKCKHGLHPRGCLECNAPGGSGEGE